MQSHQKTGLALVVIGLVAVYFGIDGAALVSVFGMLYFL